MGFGELLTWGSRIRGLRDEKRIVGEAELKREFGVWERDERAELLVERRFLSFCLGSHPRGLSEVVVIVVPCVCTHTYLCGFLVKWEEKRTLV